MTLATGSGGEPFNGSGVGINQGEMLERAIEGFGFQHALDDVKLIGKLEELDMKRITAADQFEKAFLTR